MSTAAARMMHSTARCARNSTSERWTLEEDEVLRQGVRVHGAKRWKTVASLVASKTPPECAQRWHVLQSHGSTVKRAWLPSEDRRICELVAKYGARQWAIVASHIDGRTGKQCRERWHNQLDPAITKAPWTPHEVELIRRRHAKYGNRWAKITEALPGRTDNAVKNYWYSAANASRFRFKPMATSSSHRSRSSNTIKPSITFGSESESSAKLSPTLLATPTWTPSQAHASASSGRPCAMPNAPTHQAADHDVVAHAEQQYQAWLASVSLETWDDVVLPLPALPVDPVKSSLCERTDNEALSHEQQQHLWMTDRPATAAASAPTAVAFDANTSEWSETLEPLAPCELDLTLECMAPCELDELLRGVVVTLNTPDELWRGRDTALQPLVATSFL